MADAYLPPPRAAKATLACRRAMCGIATARLRLCLHTLCNPESFAPVAVHFALSQHTQQCALREWGPKAKKRPPAHQWCYIRHTQNGASKTSCFPSGSALQQGRAARGSHMTLLAECPALVPNPTRVDPTRWADGQMGCYGRTPPKIDEVAHTRRNNSLRPAGCFHFKSHARGAVRDYDRENFQAQGRVAHLLSAR